MLQDRVVRRVLLAPATTSGTSSGALSDSMLQLVSWNHTAIVLVSSLRFGLAVVEIAAMSARYPRVLFASRCVLLLQLICGHAVLMG